MILVKKWIPLEKRKNGRIIIKQIELLSVLGRNQVIECFDVIQMTFANYKIVLKISGLFVDYRHY